MFLHLGADVSIKNADIICILDLESISKSKHGQILVKNIPISNQITFSKERTKSYVLVEEKGEIFLYHSPISTQTLLKRQENIKMYV